MSSSVALGSLRKITYIVTSKNRSNTVVIPPFKCVWYFSILKTDVGYNGDVRTEFEDEESGNFFQLDVANVENVTATNDTQFSMDGNDAIFPFNIRARVVTSPTIGQCKIVILYMEP